MDQWSIASSLNRRALLRRAGTAAAGLVALPLSACEAQNSLFSADGAGANPLAIPELNQGIVEQGERVFRLSSRGRRIRSRGRFAYDRINAPYLGPTLEMRRGERVRLHVDNGLDDGATVHWRVRASRRCGGDRTSLSAPARAGARLSKFASVPLSIGIIRTCIAARDRRSMLVLRRSMSVMMKRTRWTCRANTAWMIFRLSFRTACSITPASSSIRRICMRK